MGIGGSVLSILTQFPSNRSQHVMVDGCRRKLVNAVSGVRQGSVLGPLLFLLCTSELFSTLENKLIGYADDSSLMAVVPSPGVRVAVAESLIRNFGRVSEWCDLWGMKLHASKTKTMIVSRSRIDPPFWQFVLISEINAIITTRWKIYFCTSFDQYACLITFYKSTLHNLLFLILAILGKLISILSIVFRILLFNLDFTSDRIFQLSNLDFTSD